MRIEKEETLCLAIDYQEKLMPVIERKEEMTGRSVRLLKGMKILHIPLIVTEQYPKGLGNTVSGIKEAACTEALEKIEFSCAQNQNVMDRIKEYQKKNILICGIEAHICVLQTVIDLQREGYQTVLAADCIGSRREEDKFFAIERAKAEGSVITTSEAILYELMKKAGTQEFREILKMIK
jgi:hypothetical protein